MIAVAMTTGRNALRWNTVPPFTYLAERTRSTSCMSSSQPLNAVSTPM
jgi:hypothetical protein